MKMNKIIEIAHTQIFMANTFANLGYLLGQRNMIAKDVIQCKERVMRDPEEYKKLMMDAIDDLNKQIKELLILT